jgi:Tannase and feruloyl esterase
LTQFARRGGKFLIIHGTADTTIPTNASVLYYEMLQSRMTKEEMNGFLRLYLIPGFGHGHGNFNAAMLSACLIAGSTAALPRMI